jgi:hypothetical protein
MIPAHNFYGPKLKCYGLKFLFAKINLHSITFSKISPFLMAHEWKICTPQQPCDWRHHLTCAMRLMSSFATWTNQRAKRGATRVRHVDKPECDTWTNLSATRGPFRARHVDKPQRDTWRCVKEPRHHIHVSTCLATSAASMGRATWHPLPWPISWPFGLVI